VIELGVFARFSRLCKQDGVCSGIAVKKFFTNGRIFLTSGRLCVIVWGVAVSSLPREIRLERKRNEEQIMPAPMKDETGTAAFEIGQRVGRLDALIYGNRYGTSIVDGRDDDYARGYRAGYAAYHAERERAGKRKRAGKRGR